MAKLTPDGLGLSHRVDSHKIQQPTKIGPGKAPALQVDPVTTLGVQVLPPQDPIDGPTLPAACPVQVAQQDGLAMIAGAMAPPPVLLPADRAVAPRGQRNARATRDSRSRP